MRWSQIQAPPPTKLLHCFSLRASTCYACSMRYFLLGTGGLEVWVLAGLHKMCSEAVTARMEPVVDVIDAIAPTPVSGSVGQSVSD